MNDRKPPAFTQTTSEFQEKDHKLFVHHSKCDDIDEGNKYIAHTMMNTIFHTISKFLLIQNREFCEIMIDTGDAYSTSPSIDCYMHCWKVMGHTPDIDPSKSKLIRFAIGSENSRRKARINFMTGPL